LVSMVKVAVSEPLLRQRQVLRTIALRWLNPSLT
jgi:hypothetical protein